MSPPDRRAHRRGGRDTAAAGRGGHKGPPLPVSPRGDLLARHRAAVAFPAHPCAPAQAPRAPRAGSKARNPMYAIVEIGGKQFKVQPDTKVYVPRTKDEVGADVKLDRVLLVGGGD